MLKVLGKTRNRREKARQALAFFKRERPNLVSQAAFNAAHTPAADRNEVQLKLIAALGDMLVHLMHELKEDEDED